MPRRWALLLLVANAACFTSMGFAPVNELRRAQPPRSADSVAVFLGTEPAAPVIELGVIMVSRENSAITSIEPLLGDLRARAGAQGCTAVIIPPMVVNAFSSHSTAFYGFPVRCILHGEAAEAEVRAAASVDSKAGQGGAGRTPAAGAALPGSSNGRAVQARESSAPPMLAVLDFRNSTSELRPENARYFTDLARGAALKQASHYRIMSRENLVALLHAAGKDVADCEGECEVETGRQIGADVIVTGELQRLGSNYKLVLMLHETASGQLLSSAFAGGATLEELEQSTGRAFSELLSPVATAPHR